jgi:hypothetical protein
MKSLYAKALLSLVALSVTMGLLLFVPGRTTKYWQAWVSLGIFTGASCDRTHGLIVLSFLLQTIIPTAFSSQMGNSS